MVATSLLAPMPPALFMGEEFAAAQPLLYFCDFNPHLVKDVAINRRKSFAHLKGFRTARTRARIPDPMDPATFQRCKLDWSSVQRSPHADWLYFYRRLLAVRRREITPRLSGMHEDRIRYLLSGDRGLSIQWTLGDDSLLTLLANYGPSPLDGTASTGRHRPLVRAWRRGDYAEPGPPASVVGGMVPTGCRLTPCQSSSRAANGRSLSGGHPGGGRPKSAIGPQGCGQTCSVET
jgi:1,4-alpha-glucan branching enzyme